MVKEYWLLLIVKLIGKVIIGFFGNILGVVGIDIFLWVVVFFVFFKMLFKLNFFFKCRVVFWVLVVLGVKVIFLFGIGVLLYVSCKLFLLVKVVWGIGFIIFLLLLLLYDVNNVIE